MNISSLSLTSITIGARCCRVFLFNRGIVIELVPEDDDPGVAEISAPLDAFAIGLGRGRGRGRAVLELSAMA